MRRLSQDDLQVVADLVAEHYGIASPTVSVRDVRKGYARFTHGRYYLTIPEWAVESSIWSFAHFRGWNRMLDRERAKALEAHGIWYVVHEVAHFVVDARYDSRTVPPHGAVFRAIEQEACALFDIVPTDYKRAYPSRLTDPSGVTLSDWRKRTVRRARRSRPCHDPDRWRDPWTGKCEHTDHDLTGMRQLTESTKETK